MQRTSTAAREAQKAWVGGGEAGSIRPGAVWGKCAQCHPLRKSEDKGAALVTELKLTWQDFKEGKLVRKWNLSAKFSLRQEAGNTK